MSALQIVQSLLLAGTAVCAIGSIFCSFQVIRIGRIIKKKRRQREAEALAGRPPAVEG